MRQVILSHHGGDRATGYAMSNKIVSLPAGCLCTWIDNRGQNQWALIDRASGRTLHAGSLGRPGTDNHCGTALAATPDEVHAITGAHHGPFQHYVLRPDKLEDGWKHRGTINRKGTYPSLVADSRGDLHLTFRSPGDRWTLDYCCCKDGRWSPPRSLVAADKPGYIYWTNGLAAGPDDSLHLLFGNTRVLDQGALYYGASHICSDNAGRNWQTTTGRQLSALEPATRVPLVMGFDRPERIQSRAEQQQRDQPGPRNVNYHQMLLSNPVVDRRAAVHVVIHNGLTGGAELWTRRAGSWSARSLTAVIAHAAPGYRIHMQSSLSLGPNDQLHAALMIDPTAECIWGPVGTTVVRALLPLEGEDMSVEPVAAPQPTCAQWLPAFEQPGKWPPDHDPALIYTKGVNAGGFGNNTNEVATEVCLCLP